MPRSAVEAAAVFCPLEKLAGLDGCLESVSGDKSIVDALLFAGTRLARRDGNREMEVALRRQCINDG